MGKKKVRVDPLPPVVTFRQIVVDFEDRTVSIDGSVVKVASRAFVIPILSGDAVFLPGRDMERVR